ncbi:MAG: hypothetical protein KatS3mg105_0813 [Gemmatales bacterium]|nr:MAG: hypothetical protein KatS3mg105_0813 [Gemmatales bacterium]
MCLRCSQQADKMLPKLDPTKRQEIFTNGTAIPLQFSHRNAGWSRCQSRHYRSYRHTGPRLTRMCRSVSGSGLGRLRFGFPPGSTRGAFA